MPYSAQLVAYVHLLLRRVAEFSSYAIGYEKMTEEVYKQTTAMFNIPSFVDRRSIGASTVVCVNDDFIRMTELIFFSLEHELVKASLHVHWRTPAISRHEKNDLEKRLLSPKLERGAIERVEELIASMLSRPSQDEETLARAENREQRTSYVDYIERDFQVSFYDYLILPGEWERFESVRRRVFFFVAQKDSFFHTFRYGRTTIDGP